ncbi:Laccase-2 [Colletotrichum scovillei]|uniref:Laccase-2 n=1 Tax=Colletotrichum scovillei TaxID=1209932 RepID=UPI0015C37CE0|nr:Laccase-2 [Colletotrichum scovillei]KAF4780802.1 Laccase-2 [Colletotrichum scovillei]KAG7039340.1 putative laccase precursor [Colletotrichum scovillei]
MTFFKRLTEFLFFTPEFAAQGRLATQLLVEESSGLSFAGSCNTANNRECWSEGFNITTDYEKHVPDGVEREFYLEVDNHEIAPDGYLVQRMLFNGTYPGPTLEGNWGDTFKITIKNKLKNHNGTSVHWHGIHQRNSNWRDGVSGVTECPIPPGEEKTYVWRATQYGTSWYHSHFSLQYADGLVGALKINGPTSMNYNEDLGPVLITDNFHKTAFSQVQLEYMGRPPAPDSMLMNGNGRYYCCPVGAGCNSDPKCVGGSNITTFNFKRGSSYKMSLVNTGTSTHTTFWIDHHNFTVVGTDFVPIEPYTASIINIAIGQRYDIIINANASKNTRTDFWIHARDCQVGGARSNLGIIRYDPTSTRLPWTPPVDDRHVCYGCLDESPKDLKPKVPRMVKNAANEGFEKDSLKVHLVGFPNDFDPDATLHKWVLKDSSLYLDWSQPSLSLVKIASDQGWENPKFPKGYEPVDLQSYKENSWVYFLIEGKFQESVDNATHKIYKTQAPVAHPMHIHGHDFVILDSGTTEFDPKNYTINRNNPPRRDVALLPVNGYLIIAFQIDNPGVWLMHCHIAWHASGGLALQGLGLGLGLDVIGFHGRR